MICVSPMIIKDNVIAEARGFLLNTRKELRHQRGVEHWQPNDKGIEFLMLQAYTAGIRACAQLAHLESPTVLSAEDIKEVLCPTVEPCGENTVDSALVFVYQNIDVGLPPIPQKESFYGTLPEVTIQDLDVLSEEEEKKEPEQPAEGDSQAGHGPSGIPS